MVTGYNQEGQSVVMYVALCGTLGCLVLHLVRAPHGALVEVAAVPRQRLVQKMRGVQAVGVGESSVEVIFQGWLEVGVYTVVNDLTGPFAGR
jgi:hypothetical protein